MNLRGKLSRWLNEIHPGIFVGEVSARVRDKLWEMTEQQSMQIYKSNSNFIVRGCKRELIFL